MPVNEELEVLLDVLAEYPALDDSECLALPARAYLSAELHALEVERIFRRSWLCVGREEQVPKPGDYFCIDVMGEPVVVVRGEDGVVRALNSVCRHRYMPLVQDAGNVRRFVCPYHAWTYDTSGRLRHAPHMEGSVAFDAGNCRLPAYRLEAWFGFLFVNLDDDAEPLAPRMRTLEQHIASYRVHQQRQVMDYQSTWAGNWKLSAENSMEYYHHIGLHRGTVGGQMPASGTYLPPAPVDHSFTHARCRMDDGFRQGRSHPFNPVGKLEGFSEEELTTGYMVYVFPAFTMAMRPNTNNWLSFRPHGPESTRVLGGYLVSPEQLEQTPDLVEQRRGLISKVNEEDALATTELAKVMRSTRLSRGALSPFEGTIAEFYRYLARTLAPADGNRRAEGVSTVREAV